MVQSSLRDTVKILHSALFGYFAVTRLPQKRVMNYTEEILHAILIAVVVANFLLNTRRALQAIELCKESLALLSNKALSVKMPLRKKFHRIIYHTIFEARMRAK